MAAGSHNKRHEADSPEDHASTGIPAGQVLASDGLGGVVWNPIGINDWHLDGNTVVSEKWLGTIDNFDLPFRTNNIEWLRLKTTGEFGVGTTGPSARFHVVGAGLTSGTDTAVFHNSTGSSNSLIIRDDGMSAFGTTPASSTRLTVKGIGSTGATTAFSVFNSSNDPILQLGDGRSAVFTTYDTFSPFKVLSNPNAINGSNAYGAYFEGNFTGGSGGPGTNPITLYSIVNSTSVSTPATEAIHAENNVVNSNHNYGVVSLVSGGLISSRGGYFQATGVTDNIAGIFTASGGVNNYALIVPSGGGDSGFGTSVPTAKVHIDGTLRYVDTFQSAGKVLASDAFGNATWQAINTLPGGQTENFNWKFDVNTIASDPGSGYFKGNSNVPANITKLYFDDLTNDGFDISNVFSIIKGQWLIYFQDTDDATKFVSFSLLADDLVDNTGWWTMPVTFLQVGAGGLPSNNQRCTFLFVNKNTTPSSQGNTGALTYGGMTAASGTTVNIGALTGWVVDNETDPNNPVQTRIDYPGALGVTVPTIGSGQLSYLLMLPDGAGSATLVWQNTFPTSAQRKTHIYASKASHPNLVSLGVVGNETDYITSPIGLTRDFFQAVNYVNRGINATAATPGLTFATSAGTIIGNGINFYLSRTNPNEISRAASNPTSFFYRTQTGGATGAVTAITPAVYDVGGVITPIPGGPNVTTIQYIYAIPFNGVIGFVTLYGQVLYGSIVAGIAAVGKENPVVFPNLIRDAILVGILVVRKGATDLTLAGDAQFFKADYFGQAAGGSGGTSVTTLQQAYDNSGAVDPQILTSAANDGVKFRRGSAADTDSVIVIQDGTGTAKFTINGNGAISRRVVATTQSATPAINTNVTDTSIITGLAQAITSFTTNLTGTPISEDKLWISITDNGTARAITWGASFEASTVTLPTTTVISTRLDVGFTWNAVTSKWRCVAVC